MTTMVCIEAELQPDRIDDAVAFLRERFPETRDYPGCKGIHAYLHDDGKTMVFVELWEARENFERYLAWRQESGSFEKFTDMVVGDMNIRTFAQVDA